MHNKILITVVKVLIVCGMVIGLALAVYVLAFVMPEMVSNIPDVGVTRVGFIAAGLLGVLCVVGCELIAITLFKMMCSLDKDPFVEDNVKALRRMGWTALAVMVSGLLTLVIYPVPLAVIAALPIGMCGLFSLVLSGVFEKAVAFKQENDLTV